MGVMTATHLLQGALQRGAIAIGRGTPRQDDRQDGDNSGENEDEFAANKQLLGDVETGAAHSALHAEHRRRLNEHDAGGEEEAEMLGTAVNEESSSGTHETGHGENGAHKDDEDDENEGVGAVKIQPGHEEEEDDEEGEEEEDSESHSSAGSDEVERGWGDEDDGGQEIRNAELSTNPNRCIFCQKDEDTDPNQDSGLFLACCVCGDNAHERCARNRDTLSTDQDVASWRCSGCVENALEPELAMSSSTAALMAQRSSVPRLARDLLPSQRGAIKPDSHSVFNSLIVDDDPMDGSRLLRKRKTSSAEPEELAPSRKRRKDGSNGSAHLASEDASLQGTSGPGDRAISEDDEEHDDLSRPSRALRPKIIIQPSAHLIKQTRTSLVIGLRVNKEGLQAVLCKEPHPRKKRSRPVVEPLLALTQSAPSHYSQPFYSFHDRENDELKSKPYGGILSGIEADTSKTLPSTEERRRFDGAKRKAEDNRNEKLVAQAAELGAVKKVRKVSGPASQIECIQFGEWEIDTWYAAPYPEEYSRNRVLYICEFCLKYMNSDYVAWRHKMKCPAKHPPGDEIYRDRSVSIFEVDGRKNPVYCQNLCLLAKLFLGSKTLYYDVEPFLFYVMTECDQFGFHFVGYFSKEKRPSSQNNVSCILTLPIHQRKGYGNLLIDFSYLLTRVEKKCGSPEKPLSDMGLVSYRNYWRLVLCYTLREQSELLSVALISERTGMTPDDVVSALEGLRALVRDPVTSTYAYRLDFDFYEETIKNWESKAYVRLNPKRLVWTPYVMGRQNTSIMEHGPPVTAIAPREEDGNEAKIDEGKGPVTNSVPRVILNGADAHDDAPVELRDANPARHLDLQDTSSKMDEMGMSNKTKEKENGTEPFPNLVSESLQAAPASPQSSQLSHAMPSTPNEMALVSSHDDAARKSHSPIPPTRFEIFPPIKATRPSFGRSPSSVVGPRSRNVNGRPAPRRRTTGFSRRLSRRNPDKRRRGGTGRGPGRWPKGTKKADFGYAASGPGLPPTVSETGGGEPQNSRVEALLGVLPATAKGKAGTLDSRHGDDGTEVDEDVEGAGEDDDDDDAEARDEDVSMADEDSESDEAEDQVSDAAPDEDEENDEDDEDDSVSEGEAEDEEDSDAILYETAEAVSRSRRRGQSNGVPARSRGTRSKRSTKLGTDIVDMDAEADTDLDLVVGDVDADGEEE